VGGRGGSCIGVPTITVLRYRQQIPTQLIIQLIQKQTGNTGQEVQAANTYTANHLEADRKYGTGSTGRKWAAGKN